MKSIVEIMAEGIWRAEAKVATGKDRTVEWDDGVSEENKDIYRNRVDAQIKFARQHGLGFVWRD